MHDVWPSPALVHSIYIFGGFCPLTEFRHVQNSLCVKVLRSRILAALLHGTPAAGVSQTLWRGTRNGITKLSQRAPPIFSWAAIKLGIIPHSSFLLCMCYMYSARCNMNLVGIALKVVLILFCWVNSTLLLSCTASYVGIVWLYVLYFAF